jgi:hypothetical protein
VTVKNIKPQMKKTAIPNTNIACDDLFKIKTHKKAISLTASATISATDQDDAPGFNPQ